jgi:hypothetical protein
MLTIGTASSANWFGYSGISAANGFLMIGGSTSSTMGATPEDKIANDALSAGPTQGNWNANGATLGTGNGRFLPASALDGGFIYIVGGANAVVNPAAGTAQNSVFVTTY